MATCSSSLITEEDCLEIIRRKFGSSFGRELVAFNLEPLGEISGFLGEHSRLKITVECAPGGTTELSFFVKSLSASESLKEYTLESGAFHKEERMFAEIVPLLLRHGVSTILDCTPRCHLIRPSERLVFDDLSAEGYRVLDHRKSLSLNELEVVVNALAKFHACGIILEEKLTPYRLPDDHQKEFTEAFFHRRGELGAGFLRCVAKASAFAVDLLLGAEAPSGFKKFVEGVVGRFPELAGSSAKHRNAICHGDLWAANLMCKFEGDRAVHCKLVDFQFYRYTPPASDLIALLHLTTDREFRNAHAQHVVEYYYEQLKTVLGENQVDVAGVVPYEDFLQSCASYRVFAAAQSLVYFQLIMVPAEEVRAFFGDPEMVRKVVLEDRSELLTTMCGKYPEYRRRLLEAVLDLKDLYENNNKFIH